MEMDIIISLKCMIPQQASVSRKGMKALITLQLTYLHK